MLDKVLQQDEGLTYNLFRKDVNSDFITEEKKDEKTGLTIPRHIFIKEVVTQPEIHFYNVPRLGSYLAIKLEYSSCLSEESFDFSI